jgi:hypothetical protein
MARAICLPRTCLRWTPTLAVLTLCVATPQAGADRIVLRGGGQIRGKVLPDPKKPDGVLIVPERGKKELHFLKAQITEVVAEPSALDEYIIRREKTPATAEAQHALGLWCEQQKLRDLATLHYEAAVARDNTFGPAQKKLGRVQVGDRWLSGDDLRAAQGLVRYRGKWITAEELEQHRKDDALAAENETWARRIRQMREAYVYGAEDRRREAETQFMAIEDSSAIVPLVKVLGPDEPPLRILLARVLGIIPGPEAASALVARILVETDGEVRQKFLSELDRRKEPEISKRLAQGLRSDKPEVVNRAAWVIANLRLAAAVPALIEVLVTSRTDFAWVNTASTTNPGNMNSSFGSGVPLIPNGLGVPVASNGSAVGYQSGPAVGPGYVGYGVAAVPVYSAAATYGGFSGTRGPVPTLVTTKVRNVEVHSALLKLTGEDFGYDANAWKTWLKTSYRAESSTPAKTVPQP